VTPGGPEGGSMTSSDLVVRVVTTSPVPVVSVSGSLYLRTVPLLMGALVEVLERPARAAVCDLGDLDVPDSDSSLIVFAAALRRAGGWPAASLHLAGAGPQLERALRRSRLQRHVSLHAGVPSAVQAAAAERGRQVQEMTLPACPESLRAVREMVREVWTGLTGTSTPPQAALVVATELGSNAVRHVCEPFTLTVAAAAAAQQPWLTMAVTDTGADEPILRPPRPTAVRGRGLQLVSGLSTDWGVRLVHPRGKTVWATVPVARASGQD
jgi:hypothetical protein